MSCSETCGRRILDHRFATMKDTGVIITSLMHSHVGKQRNSTDIMGAKNIARYDPYNRSLQSWRSVSGQKLTLSCAIGGMAMSRQVSLARRRHSPDLSPT